MGISNTVMENDVVFVGKKPIMSYVLAVLTHMNSGHDKVVLKARGSTISKAVDISQIVKRKFSKDLKISNVEIGTEELPNEQRNENTGDRKRNVSFIAIEMGR